MPEKKAYVPFDGVSVPFIKHPGFHGASVSEEYFPFSDKLDNLACAFIPENQSEEDDSSSHHRISDIHGRSFQINFGENTAVLWADQYGNIFTSLGTKGSSLEHPVAINNPQAPGNFSFYGLQDSRSISRIVIASQLMRQANIDTELIARIYEPLEFPIEGASLTRDQFKKRLVKDAWDRTENKAGEGLAEREDVPALSQSLNQTAFLITLRGMRVPERLADLAQASPKDKELILKRAITAVNVYESARAKIAGTVPIKFDPDSPQSVSEYLTDYIPQNLGRNMAKLHRLGLAFRSASELNITLSGGFPDLDTVKGQALGLGDEPITKDDFANDLWEAAFTFEKLDLYMPGKLTKETLNKAKRKMLRTYTLESGLEEDVVTNFQIFSELIDTETVKNNNELVVYYGDLLSRQTGVVPSKERTYQSVSDRLFDPNLSASEVASQAISEAIRLKKAVLPEGADKLLRFEEQTKAENSNLQDLITDSMYSDLLNKTYQETLAKLQHSETAAVQGLSETEIANIAFTIALGHVDQFIKAIPQEMWDSALFAMYSRYIRDIGLTAKLPFLREFTNQDPQNVSSPISGFTKDGEIRVVVNNVPLSKFFQEISYGQEHLDVQVFNMIDMPRGCNFLVQGSASDPKVLVCDGRIINPNYLGENSFMLDTTDCNYIAWVSKDGKYYVQTNSGEQFVRDALEKSGATNTGLNITSFE